MNEIVYGIEQWNKKRKRWVTHRMCGSFQEMVDVLHILEDAYPEWEMRLIQCTRREFYYRRASDYPAR